MSQGKEVSHCPNCGEGGFDKGWEWLCSCRGVVRIGIDSFSTPRFNQGLGCMTSSVRETEKIAKRKGLEPIGDAKMREVFKERDHKSEIREMIVDGQKRLRAQAVREGKI